MIPLRPVPGAVHDPRVLDAFARLRFEQVTDTTFDATYDLLASFFGPSAEIEPREVLRADLAAPRWEGEVAVVYFMLRIVDEAGTVLAVGDGRYAVAPDLILGLGSNLFTNPAHRGARLATAVDLCDKRPFVEWACAQTGGSPEVPWLIMADVEAIDPDVPETLLRLDLWSRCNWSVFPPEILPFALLGQADPADPVRSLGPVPSLAIVRGGQNEQLLSLPRARVARAIELLGVLAAGGASAEEVAEWRAVADAALARWPGEDVPLLPLPRRDTPPDGLVPFLRSTLLAAMPEGWRG